jgi:hypothetical protein
MTPIDLYQLFIAGKDLPALGTRQARSLLDLCRSKLLAMGRRVKPSSASDPADIKTELLEAHRALVGGDQVYCMAATEPTLMNGISNDRLLDEFERFKRTNPNGSLLQHLTTLHSDPPPATPRTRGGLATGENWGRRCP